MPTLTLTEGTPTPKKFFKSGNLLTFSTPTLKVAQLLDLHYFSIHIILQCAGGEWNRKGSKLQVESFQVGAGGGGEAESSCVEGEAVQEPKVSQGEHRLDL